MEELAKKAGEFSMNTIPIIKLSAISNLIKDRFKNNKELSVLEPSIGIGNFVYATGNFQVKSEITGFEINETTAKIAKIFHPNANINLRSFETEFIDEKGGKVSPVEYRENTISLSEILPMVSTEDYTKV